jgi:predicted metal-dependent peptidase
VSWVTVTWLTLFLSELDKTLSLCYNDLNKRGFVLNKPFELNKYTYRLLQDEPFWASLSRRIHKRASTEISTAGVRVNPADARFEMIYNPEFFAKLSDKDKGILIRHEFFHLILGHCTFRAPAGGQTKAWNVAQDLAINSELFANTPHETGEGTLYDMCCIPGKKPFENYESGLTSDAYYAQLKNDPKFKPEDGQGQPGEGGGSGGTPMPDSVDDHGGFGEVSQEIMEVAKQRLREAAQEASNDASKTSTGWGTVSADMRKSILDMLKNTVDWRAQLRYIIKASQRADKKSSIKRVNRRYPYIQPGRKIKRQAKIALAIDESGSVSNELLATFFAECNGLARLAEFTVIPFDYSVTDSLVFVWKKGQKVVPSRDKTGGTNFQAPTDYTNERDFDALFILTDMEAPKPGKSNAQRFWVTDPRGADNTACAGTERVITVQPRKTD